jgi:hypothetical protein
VLGVLERLPHFAGGFAKLYLDLVACVLYGRDASVPPRWTGYSSFGARMDEFCLSTRAGLDTIVEKLSGRIDWNAKHDE